MPDYENSNRGKIVETKTEARAGVTGQGGSIVLVISTLAIIVVFAIVYLYFFA
ncbi:MAG: hypothetical protein WA792_07510 [Pseudolabrys sp.]